MFQLWKPLLAAGALLSAGLPGLAQPTISARPGAVNYVEGRVTVNGRAVSARSVRSTAIDPGQVLETAQGKAEVLLTPGVFVRLDDNSALRMVSPSLTNTEVALERGRALVEVDQIQKENHLDIIDNGVRTTLEKKGIYQFDAGRPLLQVYDGKAVVREGDRDIDVGKGKELALAADVQAKPQKFDRHQTDELYAWSKLRSEYEAEANLASTRAVIVNNPGWYGNGWYWNPYWSTWAFMPGSGYLYSPFGYGFYSPAFVYSYPPVYYGYGYGYRGFGGYRGGGFRGGRPVTAAPAGGSGVQFGGTRGFQGARPAAPAAAPVGGSGVRFGATGRR